MLSNTVFIPVYAVSRPWIFLSAMFLHATNLLHVLFNMLTLWSIGPVLEKMMGHWRFLTLYVLAGLGGGVGMMVWSVFSPSGWVTASYGASGALFGLFAAVLIVFRRIGADIRSMSIWIGINVLMPLVYAGNRVAGACGRLHHRWIADVVAGVRRPRVAKDQFCTPNVDICFSGVCVAAGGRAAVQYPESLVNH
jgi:membrane associated rhomboid family serine protease